MVIPTFSCFGFSILDFKPPKCHIEPEKDRVLCSGFMLNSTGVSSAVSESEGFVRSKSWMCQR